MTNTDLIPIREQLNRIEKKIDGKVSNRYLDINKVDLKEYKLKFKNIEEVL